MQTGKTYDGILSEIRRMSEYFTPEWRYNPSNPDAGTLLCQVWARMLSDTYERLELLPESAESALLELLGASGRPAASASGYLCFTPEPEETVTVPAGTRVAASDDPEQELITEHDVIISEAAPVAVYEASNEPDCASRFDGTENLPLFRFSGRNLRLWLFEHPFALSVSEGGALLIDPGFTENGEAFAAMLAEQKCAAWECLTPDGFLPVASVAAHGGNILIYPGERGLEISALRLSILDKGAFGGAQMRGPRIFPQNTGLKPDAAYYGELPQTDEGFFPFGERFMVYDTFSVACDEALTKPGAFVELSFSIRTLRVPIEGYPRPVQEWKPIMRPEDIIKIDEREISISRVSWEYFNGTGWNALPVELFAREAFSAGEDPAPCRICFKCPEDISPIAVGAHEKNFVRARILSVENAFHMYGWYLSPWIDDLRLSYNCAEGYQPSSLRGIRNLDESVYEDFEAPIELIEELFPKRSVYFEFSQSFSTGSLLWELEPGRRGVFPVRFEYYSERGWLALDTGLEDLGKSALMSYSTSAAPRILRLFGREAYWMRVSETGAEQNERDRPVLRRIWQNAVSARAASPGAQANGGPGRYSVVISPLKGVNSVTNPGAIMGGRDAETDESANSRLSQIFAHGGRAVSRSDIEYLAMDASPDVISCRCFPNTDAEGAKHPRDSCLVLYASERSEAAFDELADCVRGYMLRRSPVHSGVLHIIKPHFVTLSVIACIVTTGGAHTARPEILQALCRFIDPAKGHFNSLGWPVGSVPSAAQISNMLKTLKCVKYVESVRIIYRAENGDSSTDTIGLKFDPFILPRSGEHELEIKDDA